MGHYLSDNDFRCKSAKNEIVNFRKLVNNYFHLRSKTDLPNDAHIQKLLITCKILSTRCGKFCRHKLFFPINNYYV